MKKIELSDKSEPAKLKTSDIFNQKEPVEIFNSKRSSTLWFLTLISFITSFSINYMLFTMDIEKEMLSYSTNYSFWFWQVIFFILGHILLLSIMWLSGKYVVKAEIFPGEIIQITTWSIFIKRKYILNRDDFVNKKFHKGVSNLSGAPSVNAPWIGLKTKKGKLLVFDLQGNFPYGFNTFDYVF